MAEGAPLLREYTVRSRIEGSTLVAAAPTGASAVSHPETTAIERPESRVDRVRLRVLDKVEARKVEMTVPTGVTVPLPDAVHSVRVTRYTEDFSLDRMSSDGSKTPDAEPVPRESDETNPAVRLKVFRQGEPVAETWVFARLPSLFQPPNMRYNFALLGAEGTEEGSRRP
ncbi:MAG: hypothetical protein ABEJ96_01360 [Thiohalorhabdaceae bacterium]